MLRRHSDSLADGIAAAIGPWVERCVVSTIENCGGMVTGHIRSEARAAADLAAADVVPRVRALLSLDIDEQRTGPLAILRSAVAFPTAVLRTAGVPPVDRDNAAAEMFPEDIYDLVPASFGDLDPSLQEKGIVWGAAKAHVHLARRRALGG